MRACLLRHGGPDHKPVVELEPAAALGPTLQPELVASEPPPVVESGVRLVRQPEPVEPELVMPAPVPAVESAQPLPPVEQVCGGLRFGTASCCCCPLTTVPMGRERKRREKKRQ